jgi:hypothetical protein
VKVLVLNGPNLGRLGTREPDVYGATSYGDLVALCQRAGAELGLEVDVRQTDHEGVMMSWLLVWLVQVVVQAVGEIVEGRVDHGGVSVEETEIGQIRGGVTEGSGPGGGDLEVLEHGLRCERESVRPFREVPVDLVTALDGHPHVADDHAQAAVQMIVQLAFRTLKPAHGDRRSVEVT